MSALGAVLDLVGPYAIVKGLPWAFKFTRKAGPGKVPVDLTGATARLEIHDLLAGGPPVEFSTASGHIVLGGAAGTVDVALTAGETLLAAQRARYRLYLTPAGGREQLLLRGRLGLLEDGE